MRIVSAGYEILTPIDGAQVLRHIERIGRVCYKSEDKITPESAPAFVKMLIARGHEAMIEHYSFSVKFICDRGVSHEIVRHRIASFAQESTRYCNYSKDKYGGEITVIAPFFWPDESEQFLRWREGMESAERAYFALLAAGATAQEARAALPSSLKTELVMTANLREWRHFFKLRAASAAHPQMREVAAALLEELKTLMPVVFDDIATA
ncbi:MAG: FAD-dependent thymidylate synthase [Oscillospiraceae bacterium]|jgi:thymidylate synthase (FAD)|nr:FAD-dependent thymidylate synthase [Oscillospiraceae bacterium]